jgi:hypothetical protein
MVLILYHSGMKISQLLPHFPQPILLISSGKQEAVIFLAEKEEVHQVHNVKINKPEYTDRESRTERRGEGNTSMFGGGSGFKHLEDELVRSFVKRLSDDTVRLVDEHRATKIFLFCPTYLSNQIEDSLPTDVQKLIDYIFYGNYHNQHPFVLLAKVNEYIIAQESENRVEPIKGEALSILKNTRPSI